MIQLKIQMTNVISWLVNLPPPPKRTPPEIRPCYGVINHWFPLIGPAIKPFFLGAVRWGGRLTSHDNCSQLMTLSHSAWSRWMSTEVILLVGVFFSKNFPTYPWNIPQTPNQRFMKEFLSFGVFSGFLGYAKQGYVGVFLDFPTHLKNMW